MRLIEYVHVGDSLLLWPFKRICGWEKNGKIQNNSMLLMIKLLRCRSCNGIPHFVQSNYRKLFIQVFERIIKFHILRGATATAFGCNVRVVTLTEHFGSERTPNLKLFTSNCMNSRLFCVNLLYGLISLRLYRKGLEWAYLQMLWFKFTKNSDFYEN